MASSTRRVYTHLRDLVVRFRLSSVDDIRELHGVLDKEHRDVVADDVPISLLGIEFDGETTNIAYCVCRSTAPKDG